MKRKWKRVLGVIVAGITLVAGVSVISAWREPRFEGRRLSHWLEMDGEDAIESGVFENMDPKAIPWLISQIKRGPKTDPNPNSPPFSWLINWAPPVAGWLGNRIMEKRQLRSNSLYALSNFHEGTEAAIPVLIRLLGNPDDDDSGTICQCLTRALPSSLPHLLEAAADPSAVVRENAIFCLKPSSVHDLSPDACTRLVGTLLKAMDDPAAGVRRAATNQLISQTLLGHGRKWFVEQIGRKDAGANGDRYENAELLDAVAARMVVALHDPDPQVRQNAKDALQNNASDAGSAIPKLVALLGDPAPQVRASAVSCLAKMKAPPELVFGPIRALTADADANCRIEAAVALAAYGGKAETVVAEQVARLKNHDPAERWAGITVLERIGSPAADEAVPALIQALRLPLSATELEHVTRLIQEFGKNALSQMLEESRELLKHDDPQIRRNAVLAVGTLVGSDDQALSAILAALRTPGISQDDQISLVKRLGSFANSPRGSIGVPCLIEVLSFPSTAIRLEAVKALPRNDPRVDAALRLLADDPDHAVWKAVTARLAEFERLKTDGTQPAGPAKLSR